MLDRPGDPQQHIVVDYHNPYLLSITQKSGLVNPFFRDFQKIFSVRVLPPSFMRGVAEAIARPGGVCVVYCDADSPLPLRGIPPHK